MWGHFLYSGAIVFFRLGPKLGKLYAMTKYMERFRRRIEEIAAAAALLRSNIDTARE